MMTANYTLTYTEAGTGPDGPTADTTSLHLWVSEVVAKSFAAALQAAGCTDVSLYTSETKTVVKKVAVPVVVAPPAPDTTAASH